MICSSLSQNQLLKYFIFHFKWQFYVSLFSISVWTRVSKCLFFFLWAIYFFSFLFLSACIVIFCYCYIFLRLFFLLLPFFNKIAQYALMGKVKFFNLITIIFKIHFYMFLQWKNIELKLVKATFASHHHHFFSKNLKKSKMSLSPNMFLYEALEVSRNEKISCKDRVLESFSKKEQKIYIRLQTLQLYGNEKAKQFPLLVFLVPFHVK